MSGLLLDLQLEGGVQDGFERVRGAVIAAVHEDEFVLEIVFETEGVGRGIDGLDKGLVRPGGNGDEFVADGAAIFQTLSHEAVEGDDEVGVFEDALVSEFEDAGGEAGWFYFSKREELVGVEVHGPIDGGDAADGGG